MSFPEKEPSPTFDDERLMVCLLCEDTFNFPPQKEEFLKHLTFEHHFVIGQVELVADLPSYIAYWRNKFVKGKKYTYGARARKFKKVQVVK